MLAVSEAAGGGDAHLSKLWIGIDDPPCHYGHQVLSPHLAPVEGRVLPFREERSLVHRPLCCVAEDDEVRGCAERYFAEGKVEESRRVVGHLPEEPFQVEETLVDESETEGEGRLQARNARGCEVKLHILGDRVVGRMVGRYDAYGAVLQALLDRCHVGCGS